MYRLVFILLIFLSIQPVCFCQGWTALGSGCTGEPEAFLEKNGLLYIAGPFTVLGNTVNRICSFDGLYFDTLGPGLNGTPYCLTIYNNELHAAGTFPYAGVWPGVPGTQHIAKWNGGAWESVGGGVTGSGVETIYSMAVYNGELYVGGYILNIGGVPVGRIAKWDGSSWSNVGGGFSGQAVVQCMTVYNNELIVGGYFNLPGAPNNYYYNIVRWNGTQWDSLGGKADGWIKSLEVDTVNNLLYAGGGITNIGGTPVNSIGAWNGTGWSSPGVYPSFASYDMQMFQNELFAAGSGFAPVTLSKWNGMNWSGINPDPNNTVISLGLYNNNLYVGGYFDSVGVWSMSHIACYGTTCPLNVGFSDGVRSAFDVRIYPNPFSEIVSIEIFRDGKDVSEFCSYSVFDRFGRMIVSGHLRQNTQLRIENLASGIYIINITDESVESSISQKLIKY